MVQLQQVQQRLGAVLAEVKNAHGIPQEAVVHGLDERGLIVDMHAGAPKAP